MKMDKFGYWIMNDVVKPLTEQSEESEILRCAQNDTQNGTQNDAQETEPDVTIFTDDPKVKERLNKLSEAKKIHGSCALSIRFENHGEYLRWKKYFGSGRQWDFIVSYPAVMRAVYKFSNSLEVEVMAKKVVQLLEAGFNVYSASWTLDEGSKNDGKQEDI